MSDNEFKVTLSQVDGVTFLQVEWRLAGEYGKALAERFDVKPPELRLIDALIGMLRERRMVYKKEFMVLGEVLFSLLFFTPDRREYNSFGWKLKEAIQKSHGLLRLVLEFNEQQPHYATWPWEYLYWPQRPGEEQCSFFVAQGSKLLLSRYVMLDAKAPPPAKPPLRVLFVTPSPTKDTKLVAVEATSVRESLEELQKRYDDVGEKRLTFNPLQSPGPAGILTYKSFVSRLRTADPHVIHFVGHGRYDIGRDGWARGQLAFTDEDGREAWIDDQRFAEDIAESAPGIRLVVLQACESADTGRSESYQAVSGVAEWLSHKNIPAIVAMHYRVSGRVGNLFSRTFYEALTERQSVGEAMNQARQVLSDNEGEDMPLWSSFGLPVLYLRDHAEVLAATEVPGKAQMGSVMSHSSGASYRCPYDEVEFDPPNEEYFCGKCLRPLVCQEIDPLTGTKCLGIRRRKSDHCLKCGRPWRDPSDRQIA